MPNLTDLSTRSNPQRHHSTETAASLSETEWTGFRRLSLAWTSAGLTALAFFGTGCGEPNQYQAPPPPNVKVALPVVQTVTGYVEQTGIAQASERVELRSRVAGYLVERNFEDGDFVKAGQLLFVIDEEPFTVRVEYARARQSEAESNLKKAKQSKAREIATAQLQLNESELLLARVNHERNIQLLGQNALSRQEYDRTEAALRTADARVVASKAELEQAVVDYDTNILAAQATLDLAKSELRTAEINLGYCRITAPIDGLIDRRAFDIGNYVTDDNTKVLASIVSVNPIYAYASISEEDLLRLKKRYAGNGDEQKIPIHLGIGEDRTFPIAGTIDYISPGVQSDTGTVQIRGVFQNNGLVMPGMFIRIRVPSEIHENALLVSERSLGYDQAGTFIYTVNEKNAVEQHKVVAGESIDGMRVVTGEIHPDDKVVSDGLLKVRPGMTVTPRLPGEEDAPPAEDTASAETKPAAAASH